MQKGDEKAGPEAVFSEWSKMTNDFLSNVGNMWAPWTGGKQAAPQEKAAEKDKQEEKKGSLPKNWLEWAMVAQDPASLYSLFQGFGNIPQILAKKAESRWDQLMGLQNQWLAKIAAVGEKTKSFSFDPLDQSLFDLWNDIYDKEIRRNLQMPSVGLTRFYQERISKFIDSFNVFQSAFEQFSHLLAVPVEQTSKAMTEKVGEMVQEGQALSDPHEIYNLWVKVLEGHYMTLFKSEKYGQVMGKTMDAFGEFIIARKALLEDFMQILPVATEKDSHDLYKEIYILNKQVKKLTRRVETLQTKLEESLGRNPDGST